MSTIDPLNPGIEVAITDLAAVSGDGVGRGSDGQVVFVPRSAPGDLLRAHVTERKSSFSRAELAEVMAPSPDRVDAPCPLFVDGSCGGCQWQHLSLPAQRRAKEVIVARALRRAIGQGLELRPLIGDVPAYKWRRRARLHWATLQSTGRAILGFYMPGSQRIVDVAACVQLTPAAMDAVRAIREHLTDKLQGRGEISVLAGLSGVVHVAIHGRVSPTAVARLLGKGGLHGTIVGVTLTGGPKAIHWGKRYIEVEPGLRGRADMFAQASHAGNQALLKAVDEASGPRAGLRVVEFYAGGGNITRILGRGAAELVTTDSSAVPWKPELLVGDAEKIAEELIDRGYYFHLAVLDPPRAGAEELIDALLELHPRRIVYVSCEPATLARDVDLLSQGGYRPVYAQPIDMMPQTAHVEVVVRLDQV